MKRIYSSVEQAHWLRSLWQLPEYVIVIWHWWIEFLNFSSFFFLLFVVRWIFGGSAVLYNLYETCTLSPLFWFINNKLSYEHTREVNFFTRVTFLLRCSRLYYKILIRYVKYVIGYLMYSSFWRKRFWKIVFNFSFRTRRLVTLTPPLNFLLLCIICFS